MSTDDRKPDQIDEEEDFAALLAGSETSMSRFAPGQKISARVIKISAEWVFIDTGTKGEGVLDRKEFLDPDGAVTVREGDKVTAWFM